MSEDGANERKPPFHYEGGVPIFDVHRIDEIERKQTASEQRDETYKKEQLAVNNWMMRFTGALVLCTILTGGISAYQAYVARRTAAAASDNATAAKAQADAAKAQVGEMKDSAKDTHELAVQAGNQARNTERLAISANQSMHIGERAWIFPQSIGTLTPSNTYEVNQPLSVKIIFHNTGQADYDAIASNRLHVFIHGKITYCDIFGKEHWTRFCYHLLSDGGYAICENNNGVDTSEKPANCSVKAH